MAKTKTPFFSFGSRGSVGESITSQRRGRDTVFRSLPVPTDPYSLNQAYQRWLYQDYSYLWSLASAASRQAFQTSGSRYHLTGFQYWMKYHLSNLPYIQGYWKLDNISGVNTPDSSIHSNDGTVFGASLTNGAIGKAIIFDGVNDVIDCGADTSLNFSDVLSGVCFAKLGNVGGVLVEKFLFGKLDYYWLHQRNDNQQVRLKLHTAGATPALIFGVADNKWHCYSFSWSKAIGHIYAYTDGQQVDDAALADDLVDVQGDNLGIGSRVGQADRTVNGSIDQVILYSRFLTAQEHLNHASRRYMLQ